MTNGPPVVGNMPRLRFSRLLGFSLKSRILQGEFMNTLVIVGCSSFHLLLGIRQFGQREGQGFKEVRG